jgi:hypothetical protein
MMVSPKGYASGVNGLCTIGGVAPSFRCEGPGPWRGCPVELLDTTLLPTTTEGVVAGSPHCCATDDAAHCRLLPPAYPAAGSRLAAST